MIFMKATEKTSLKESCLYRKILENKIVEEKNNYLSIMEQLVSVRRTFRNHISLIYRCGNISNKETKQFFQVSSQTCQNFLRKYYFSNFSKVFIYFDSKFTVYRDEKLTKVLVIDENFSNDK